MGMTKLSQSERDDLLHLAERLTGKDMRAADRRDFSGFTRNELIKTIRELDARQLRLLNRIAELEAALGTKLWAAQGIYDAQLTEI
jgi:hypothetical protein